MQLIAKFKLLKQQHKMLAHLESNDMFFCVNEQNFQILTLT